MEPIYEALNLLKCQSEIESRLRLGAGTAVAEERRLYAVRERLKQFPHAVTAILLAVQNLHRPVDSLSLDDIRGED